MRKVLTLYVAGDEEPSWRLVDDDVVMTPPPQFPENEVVRGKEAVKRALRLSWGTVFGDDWATKMTLREVIPIDDRRALAVTDFGPSGARSGITVASAPSAIYEIDGGRVVAIKLFMDDAEAKRAAGLE